MNSFEYIAYYRKMQLWEENEKKAKEIHDAIVELSKELKWNETAPTVVASSEKLHTYALLKGLITKEERNLLRVYFEN